MYLWRFSRFIDFGFLWLSLLESQSFYWFLSRCLALFRIRFFRCSREYFCSATWWPGRSGRWKLWHSLVEQCRRPAVGINAKRGQRAQIAGQTEKVQNLESRVLEKIESPNKRIRQETRRERRERARQKKFKKQRRQNHTTRLMVSHRSSTGKMSAYSRPRNDLHGRHTGNECAQGHYCAHTMQSAVHNLRLFVPFTMALEAEMH